jgi:hypothetical protein
MLSKVCKVLCTCALIASFESCGQGQQPPASLNPSLRTGLVPDAVNNDLVYVSDTYTVIVSVYSWYGKLLGTLTGFGEPAGLCSDARGNVFVADVLASEIAEYAHNGALRIKTLKDPGQEPLACAVDPLTGNLAVTNEKSASSGPGSISIYLKAKGRPKIYSSPSLRYASFCGYDSRGNLFADGDDVDNDFVLVELHKGGANLSTVKLNAHVGVPGAVQWDGKYLTVADRGSDVIYRAQVSGSMAKVQGQTKLSGIGYLLDQSWISGNKVIAANIESVSAETGDVLFYNYPAGGNPTKMFSGLKLPFGVTVSVAPPNLRHGDDFVPDRR